ncbi:DNA-binding response regulator [Paenibacillus sp. BIHB 4019]|uniref:DNA-binding response regulator n=1 Tax=Paenibacillus sp. BIHB 4019 TaxID=1870819 RepID=A0A1B2DEU7_9BACL|nr:response regulator [Paenibacillus sp. BIHB 4019]ANY66237.1 DNA-binding response regulator [Paenibacillus sp. BIHB 4019]
MLKAVVFDDEYIVRQGLSQMIDWQRYGVELVGTAGDGLSALEMFREQRPDIVLTDIRMPGMDGLRLIETVAGEAGDTMFIVFSGFNEFEYVMRAIGLGVVDYLEKPVTVEKIDEVMRKAIERIEKQQAFSSMKSKWEASKQELLEKATLNLLLAGDSALGKWKESYGPQWEAIAGITVLAFSSECVELPESADYRIVEVTNGADRLSAVLHFKLPADELWEQLMLQGGDCELFAAGGTYASLAEAPKSCKEALRALRYGRFLEESGLIRIEEMEGSDELAGHLTKHEESVIFSLRTGDKKGLSAALDEFEVSVGEQKLDPEQAEREILQLVYVGLEVLKETGRDIRSLGKVAHQELGVMHTREEMFRWLRGKVEAMLTAVTEARRSAKHAAVEKALAYMEARFGQDISLQELAEHVGLNATYFSLLFKEEMGISYIKHLTHERMEHAKVMLREGMLVGEVSEKVGYLNYRHFTETFKKLIGMTPKHYREAHSIERKEDGHA